MKTNLFFSAIIISISGCSSFTPPAQVQKITEDGTYWINYSSDRRGAIVVVAKEGAKNNNTHSTDSNFIVKTCSEPSPDTTVNFESQIIAGRKELFDVSGSSGQNTVILPGRDKTVMTLREALYRLCELSINRPDVNSDQIMLAYQKVIDAVTQYSEAEVSKADAEIAKSTAKMNTGSPEIPDRAIDNNYTDAKAAERSGFQNLLDGKYVEAKKDFIKADLLSPGIHNAFEIQTELAKLLKTKGEDNSKVTIDERNALYSKILNKWSYGVPKDIAAKAKAMFDKP